MIVRLKLHLHSAVSDLLKSAAFGSRKLKRPQKPQLYRTTVAVGVTLPHLLIR